MSTISVNIVSDSQQFERSMKRAERSANEFSRKTTKSFQGVAVGGVSLGKLATVGGLAIFTKKIAEAGAALVNMASDAAEAEAAFTTTFGPAVDDVNQFVDEMANKMGATRSEMKQLLAVTGAVTQGIGMTAEESANFSGGGRSSDGAALASFFLFCSFCILHLLQISQFGCFGKCVW